MIETVAIVANGPIEKDFFQTIREMEYLIAVDGGTAYCQRLGLDPNLILGDFDSSDLNEIKKNYPNIPIKEFPKEKDFSDLELAIKEVESAKKITLFGALGLRTDHSIYNLYLTARSPGKVFIETDEEIVFAISDQASLSTTAGQTLSFFPLGGPVTGINSKGLKWELKDATFDQNWMSLSNIANENEVKISIKQGTLICCMSTIA